MGYATVCRCDGALDMVCVLRVRTVPCLPFPPSLAFGQQWRSPRKEWITCVVLMSTVRGGTAPPRPAWAIPSCTALQPTRVDKFVDMCASHAPVASGIAALLCESHFFPATPSSRGTVLPRLRTAQVVRCVGSLSVPCSPFRFTEAGRQRSSCGHVDHDVVHVRGVRPTQAVRQPVT